MANFDQKVTIEIDVDTDSLKDITKSVNELKGAQQALNSMEKDLDELESNFKSFNKTVADNREQWKKTSDVDDPLSEFRGSIRETQKELGGLRDGLDEEVTVNTDIDEEGFVKNVKQNLDEKLREDEVEVDVAISEDIDEGDKAKVVGQTNAFVKEVETLTEDITLDIDQKVNEPSGLAKSNISRSATAAVSDVMPKIAPEIDLSGVEGEMDAFEQFADTMEVVSEMKEEVSEENKVLKKRNEEGEDSALGEAEAFQDLVGNAENLAEAKRSVSNANEQLTKRNERGAKSALLESGALDNLGLSALETADLAEDLTDQFRESKEAEDNNRSSLRRLSRSLDETSDSMRAANKVGGLFEDGLGSLSVNLGAFTVALRNFLTQVPLLLGALGSLGSSAVGVAGAFVTAGVAIGSAIGAGALAMAQSLDEQYQSIEGTGEALQVMMLGLRDTFLQAIAPLTENAEVMGMFRQFVVGLAREISLVADTFNVLMKRQEDWKDGVLGISGVMDELGARLREPFAEFVDALSFMFLNLQDEFMDITVGLVNALTGLTRFTTKFADGITEDTRVLDQFLDSLKEMAQVGATMFAGIEPILIAFSSAMEGVATAINSMNSAFVANIITLGLIIGGISRFGGVIASVVGLIPNLIFGITSADGSMMSMVSSITRFTKQNRALFGGLTALAESFEDLGGEMAIMSARTKISEDSFEELGDVSASLLRQTLLNTESMDEFEDELIQAALAADFQEEQVEDLNSELARLGISARVAEDGLDELNNANVDPDLDVAKGRGLTGAGGGFFAGGVLSSLMDKLPRVGTNLKATSMAMGRASTKTGALGVALKGLLGPIGSAIGGLSGLLGPLAIIASLLGGVLVGLIGNLDAIMAGLSTTVSALGSFLAWLGGEVMQIFIDTWNALLDVMIGVFMIIKPFIDLFDSLTGETQDMSGVIDVLAGSIEFLVDFLGAMLTVVGSLARILGTVIGGLLEILVIVVQMVIGLFVGGLMGAIAGTIDFFLDLFNIQGEAGTFFNGMIDLIADLIEWIGKIPELSNLAMRTFVKIFQDAFNDVIAGFNRFVDKINTLPFINFGKVQPVDFGVFGAEGARVSKDEVSAQTDSFMEGLTGKRDNTITYNEDNSTNIDQTVNADPEDQAQLSRVVTDAIAEANSFERRRQGGQ